MQLQVQGQSHNTSELSHDKQRFVVGFDINRLQLLLQHSQFINDDVVSSFIISHIESSKLSGSFCTDTFMFDTQVVMYVNSICLKSDVLKDCLRLFNQVFTLFKYSM